jgi:beta-glucosidase
MPATIPLPPPIPLDPAPAPESLTFPPGFLFGVSTAAYQVEGDNVHSDLWAWERKRGWQISGKASDGFARWEEDLRLAAALGCTAYRFSVEWGRCVPREGEPSEAALAHYRRLIARCRDLGMRPFVCLHHFTHPAWVFARHPGLWDEDALVERYLEWTRLAADAFPDVRDWVPFNELNLNCTTGYVVGYFPPGRRRLFSSAQSVLGGAGRRLMLAHRRAFALLKERSAENRVGVAVNIARCEPLVPGRDDDAARRWDALVHGAFLDGLALGRFDADLDGERETVLGEGPSVDWIGVNYYTRVFVRRAPFLLRPACCLPLYSDVVVQAPALASGYRFMVKGRAEREEDDLAREQVPEALQAILEDLWRRYRIPLMITESGVADEAGRLRARSLLAHLEAVRRAIASGADVKGFLYWSLIDNYEWGSKKPRFGLYRVDYANGCARSPTEAAEVFRRVAGAQGGRGGGA